VTCRPGRGTEVHLRVPVRSTTVPPGLVPDTVPHTVPATELPAMQGVEPGVPADDEGGAR